MKSVYQLENFTLLDQFGDIAILSLKHNHDQNPSWLFHRNFKLKIHMGNASNSE